MHQPRPHPILLLPCAVACTPFSKLAGIYVSSFSLIEDGMVEKIKTKRVINKQKEFNEYLQVSVRSCPDLHTLELQFW